MMVSLPRAACSRTTGGQAAVRGGTVARKARGAGGGSLLYSVFPSPVGRILLATTSRGLALLHLGAPAGTATQLDHLMDAFPGLRPVHAGMRHDQVRREVEEYFAGSRREFTVPLHLEGTPFQRRVWGALLGILFGETASYGEVAARIGRPGAARAVGMACHRNPVGLIVPCHRVIGASGGLTGYAGGLFLKARLLAHERWVAAGKESAPPRLRRAPPA